MSLKQINGYEDRSCVRGLGHCQRRQLDLPAELGQFDYATVSDVILHIRYTARQGLDPIKVKAALDELFQQANQSNLALLFSLRHDFPTEWSAFVNGTGNFTAAIRRDYFLYFTQGKSITIAGLQLYGQDMTKHHVVSNQATWDAATTDLGDNQAFIVTAAPDASDPTQVLTRTAGAQVFLIVRYSL